MLPFHTHFKHFEGAYSYSIKTATAQERFNDDRRKQQTIFGLVRLVGQVGFKRELYLSKLQRKFAQINRHKKLGKTQPDPPKLHSL
jgi:hypothetical protein